MCLCYSPSMFCPQCKAEYRQGFTRCADCDVDLVYDLPQTSIERQPARPEPGDPSDDPFVSFWKGDDPRVHAELCQLLCENNIPSRTIRRHDHLFNFSTRTAFEIGIPFSKFDPAEALIKDAYGSGEELPPASKRLPVETGHLPGSREDLQWLRAASARSAASQDSSPEPEIYEAFPVHDGDSPDSFSPQVFRALEPWFPEDAIAEVWEGDSPEMTELLAASLNENQIRSRIAMRGEQRVLFVLPEDEARARAIVRQVVDAVPPE